MKQTFRLFWLVALPIVLTLASCAVEDMPVVVTDDKPFTYDSEIDNSVRPGDDFYKYALGQWFNSSNPSPSITKQIQNEMALLLDDMLETSTDPVMVTLRSQVAQTLNDDSKNKALLSERLQMLEQVTTADQLFTAFEALQSLGYSPLFRLIPYANVGKKGVNIITAGAMTQEVTRFAALKDSTSLGSVVTAYCTHLDAFGFSQERIAQITENAIDVENFEMQAYNYLYEMARHPQPVPVTCRTRAKEDDQKMDEVMKLMGIADEELKEQEVLIATAGIGQLLVLFADVAQNPSNVEAFRDYMIYNVLAQDLPFVPSINKQAKPLDMLSSALRYNKYYKYRLLTESYGKENICKQQCQDIMEQMRQNFIRRVDNLDWMSASTKAEARRKAEAMTFYIGYPDQWNEKLTPEVEGDVLLATVTQLRQNAVQTISSIRGKDADELGWDLWASISQFTTDNAFYLSTTNSLVILPSWITKPRFNNDLSEATAYAVTTTFGHEFCHGFDDSGAQFDENGYYRNWWAPADLEAFQAKQQIMIDLFNQLEVYPGLMADGANTLTENMADYGGQELALECYKQRLTDQGFKGIQFDEQIKKFFLSFAHLWKGEEELDKSLLEYYYKNDNHSANHNRVNGMMRLQDDWYRLYNVKPTDKLYVAPEGRVKIW
ncbi:MAG: M13 family metallopeptidase [Prevotella sp.]|nr:M13 family metallopeptidase [Prevotella sp.]